MAHRGNNVLFPENTLESFQQSIKDGADIIETDIHTTRDGKIVCIHDKTVDRTTDGHGAVRDMTVQEIKTLNASHYHPTYHVPTKVPLLQELLEIVPDDVAIALEIKTDDLLTAEALQELLNVLTATNTINRTLILSFHENQLTTIQAFIPQLPIGLISLFKIFPSSKVDVSGLFYPSLLLMPLFPLFTHRKGQLFCPLDPTPDRRLWLYKLLKCDAILSNNTMATRILMQKYWKRAY